MQIRELVLYGRNGQKRTLAFKIGKVNIITGKSKSGKSAVGDIIEYCMGATKCNIAEGVVRDNVSWYGILFQFEINRVFVARKNPESGQQSSTYCYYNIGMDISSPECVDFDSNTNAEGINELLSQELGITENIHKPEENESRSPVVASARHTLYYCFQSQDEIAARTTLFHKQSESGFILQTIKDTLPYFLGAVSEDAILLTTEKRTNERQLKRLRRELNEKKAMTGIGTESAISLLTEAIGVGLISPEIEIDESDFNSLYATLAGVTFVTADKPSIVKNQLLNFQAKLREKEEELSFVEAAINEALLYCGATENYNDEVSHQKVRLESIGLFEKLNFDSGKCPLCSGKLTPEPPSIKMMKESIVTLDKSIARLEKERPKLRKYIEEQQRVADSIRAEIMCIKASIDGVYKQWKNASKIREADCQRATVYGRISYWLENVQPEIDTTKITMKINALDDRITEINELLSNESVRERTNSVLSVIQMFMTEWAKVFEMEYAGNPYRIDLAKGTVVVDTNRPVGLQEMGSASNWLGSHLISLFGLHKYFLLNRRPVPSFLFLDQPSQVYFPEGASEEDMDIKAVEGIYNFIFDRVRENQGGLQVIIVDHAKLDAEEFMASTVEEWRNPEDNLIPVSWYKKK